MLRILLVDDDPLYRELSKDYLEIFYEIEVDTASSAGEAIPKLRTGVFDAVVSDYRMPGMDGITFLKAIRQKGIKTPFILFTEASKEDVLIRALEAEPAFSCRKEKSRRPCMPNSRNISRKPQEEKTTLEPDSFP
jgi:CheY-like chemotaxis protein